jgi:hypothetical protein
MLNCLSRGITMTTLSLPFTVFKLYLTFAAAHLWDILATGINDADDEDF